MTWWTSRVLSWIGFHTELIKKEIRKNEQLFSTSEIHLNVQGRCAGQEEKQELNVAVIIPVVWHDPHTDLIYWLRCW